MGDATAAARPEAKAADGAVLQKLIIFSISLAVVPIASFFLSRDYIWNGNANYAAITAVLAANGVLFAYIAVSVSEDRQSSVVPGSTALDETRKER